MENAIDARRLALERRLRELAAEHEPVGARPSRVAFAAGSRSTTSDAAAALEAERQRFEDTVASQCQSGGTSGAEQLASVAKLREQLAQVSRHDAVHREYEAEALLAAEAAAEQRKLHDARQDERRRAAERR